MHAFELGKLQFLDGGEQKSNSNKEKKVRVEKKIDQTVQSKETHDIARNKSVSALNQAVKNVRSSSKAPKSVLQSAKVQSG